MFYVFLVQNRVEFILRGALENIFISFYLLPAFSFISFVRFRCTVSNRKQLFEHINLNSIICFPNINILFQYLVNICTCCWHVGISWSILIFYIHQVGNTTCKLHRRLKIPCAKVCCAVMNLSAMREPELYCTQVEKEKLLFAVYFNVLFLVHYRTTRYDKQTSVFLCIHTTLSFLVHINNYFPVTFFI